MQFSIRLLLAATALVAVGAAGGFWGFAAVAALGAALCLLGSATSPAEFALRSALLGLVLMMGMCLFLPKVNVSRESIRRAACRTHLRSIGVALRGYHDVYGTFPPAYTVDAEGNPMHSWRVLILPFLDHQGLAARYCFDEPWDGPNNSALLVERPSEFSCPSDPGNQDDTNYLAIVGPEAGWDGARPLGKDDIPGDRRAVVLLVEARETGIAWSEPRELPYEEAIAGINREDVFGISSNHPHGAHTLFLDGSVGFLHEGSEGERLARLLSLHATLDVLHTPEEQWAAWRAFAGTCVWPFLMLAVVLWFAFEVRRCRRRRADTSKPGGPGLSGELSGT